MNVKRMGQLLKECRELGECSQEYMAYKLQVSQSRISLAESGDKPLTLMQMIDWISATGQQDYFLYELGREIGAIEMERTMQDRRIANAVRELVGA